MVAKVLRGGDKLEAALSELAAKVSKSGMVRVGFFEKDRYSNGTTVATVAMVQEFGSPIKGIPPRSFFRSMIKKHANEWGPVLGGALRAMRMDTTKALRMVGEVIAGDLRQSIIETNDPPLSPVTLLLRERFWGHPQEITFADVKAARADIASGTQPNVSGTQAKPLEWTGFLLRSVGAEVSEK